MTLGLGAAANSLPAGSTSMIVREWRTSTSASPRVWKVRCLSLLAVLLLCLPGISAGEKPKAFAVIAGTVFREPGFMLPGAEVELRTTVPPPGVKRLKPITTRSDGRGEFAFHVPAGKAEYTVGVKAKGFLGEERPVKIDSEERVDIYFTLRAVK